jgi:hypothetical protein
MEQGYKPLGSLRSYTAEQIRTIKAEESEQDRKTANTYPRNATTMIQISLFRELFKTSDELGLFTVVKCARVSAKA